MDHPSNGGFLLLVEAEVEDLGAKSPRVEAKKVVSLGVHLVKVGHEVIDHTRLEGGH